MGGRRRMGISLGFERMVGYIYGFGFGAEL